MITDRRRPRSIAIIRSVASAIATLSNVLADWAANLAAIGSTASRICMSSINKGKERLPSSVHLSTSGSSRFQFISGCTQVP